MFSLVDIDRHWPQGAGVASTDWVGKEIEGMIPDAVERAPLLESEGAVLIPGVSGELPALVLAGVSLPAAEVIPATGSGSWWLLRVPPTAPPTTAAITTAATATPITIFPSLVFHQGVLGSVCSFIPGCPGRRGWDSKSVLLLERWPADVLV
jgi:hypothetical protein